jgi:hypothetical protein
LKRLIVSLKVVLKHAMGFLLVLKMGMGDEWKGKRVLEKEWWGDEGH